MKILFIKMLGVAILFTGLGGIVNQINTFFNSDEQIASLGQDTFSIGDDQTAISERSITIVRQAPSQMKFEVMTRKISGNNFKIELPEAAGNLNHDFCLPKTTEGLESLAPNEKPGRKLIIVTGRNEQLSNDKTKSNVETRKVFKFERKIEGE